MMDTNSLILLLFFVQRLPILLLYAGPDQLLPLASFLGAVIGVLLIGWQRLMMFLKRVFHFVTAKVQPSKK